MTDYLPRPAPPLGRNWADDDVAAFHGFASIELLMQLPGFPTPIPYPMKDRRWRPEDHIAFRDGLIERGLGAAPALAPAPAAKAEPQKLDGAAFIARRERKNREPAGGARLPI